MESSSFYVTCPSNASMDIYKDNTPSHFRINLPQRLYLQNNYEVALAEIQYPMTYWTFSTEDKYQIAIVIRRTRFYSPRGFSPTRYNTVQELIDDIQKTFSDTVERPQNYPADEELFKIAYNEKINRVYYDAHYQTKVQLSDECAEALGFVKSSLTGRNQYARYAPDITRGRHSLFVYCNVVDSQIVGDVYAPLLRTVAIRGERGSIVTETYDRLHYVPVNTKELSTLEFSIRDDAGDHIKFDSGKIICKLHFRPKSL